jgi:hypothetical protein
LQLSGRVHDASLPEIFRLLKIGGKTGLLRVTSGRHWGDVYFRDGEVYYASSSANGAPLGERLVRAGELSARDLSRTLAEQRAAEKPKLLGALLREGGLVTEEVLERYVREQIEDSVFIVFGWSDAGFNFILDREPPVDDVLVSLDADYVIMEGCRRVDEWGVIIERLGSLEKVPHLTAAAGTNQVALKASEWQVICYVDGRRDINTIVEESGLDRWRTAKIIYSLMAAGLALTRDPTLELLGQRLAIAVRSPIDIYNLTFLTSLCTSEPTHHLRVETVDEEPVEVHISAGVREAESGNCLLYFCETHTPLSVVRRMALETSAFVLLVNINSRDAVLASRRDVSIMKEIKEKPWVVGTYASMVDEKISSEQVRELLDIPSRVPVLNCNLRDPAETGAVIDAVVALVP